MNPSNDNDEPDFSGMISADTPGWYTPPAVPYVSPDCVNNVLAVIEQVARETLTASVANMEGQCDGL